MERWKANTDVHDKVLELVARNHPDLATVVEEIVVVFREKAWGKDEHRVYGRASAVGRDHFINILGSDQVRFILELGSDAWEHELNSFQREALLDELLTSCWAEEDENTGDVRCRTVRPDFTGYSENIGRYGHWKPAQKDGDDEDLDDHEADEDEAI